MGRACLRAWLALSLGWLVFNCAPAFATLINASFENPNMPNPSVSLVLNGWNEMEDGNQQSMPGPNSSVGIVHPLSPHPTATEGVNWAFIQLANAAASEGQFYQSLGTVGLNTQYIIRFDVSNIDSVNLGIFNPVDVRDADTTVQVYFTLGNSPPNFGLHVGGFWQSELDLLGPENAVIVNQQLTFTPTQAQVGQNLNIVFRSSRTAAPSVYPSEVWFDNIRLDIQTVSAPEPASGVIAVMGVAGLGAFGRFRTRSRRAA